MHYVHYWPPIQTSFSETYLQIGSQTARDPYDANRCVEELGLQIGKYKTRGSGHCAISMGRIKFQVGFGYRPAKVTALCSERSKLAFAFFLPGLLSASTSTANDFFRSPESRDLSGDSFDGDHGLGRRSMGNDVSPSPPFNRYLALKSVRWPFNA